MLQVTICGRPADGKPVFEFIWYDMTAGWLWKKAQAMGDFTIEALAEKLSEEYDVEADEARNDVADIIAEWQKVDVVE